MSMSDAQIGAVIAAVENWNAARDEDSIRVPRSTMLARTLAGSPVAILESERVRLIQVTGEGDQRRAQIQLIDRSGAPMCSVRPEYLTLPQGAGYERNN